MAAYDTILYVILPVLSFDGNRDRDSSDRLQRSIENRRKHHLHRKTLVLPCEPTNAYALLVSRSDPLLFLTKMDALRRQPGHRDSLFELPEVIARDRDSSDGLPGVSGSGSN